VAEQRYAEIVSSGKTIPGPENWPADVARIELAPEIAEDFDRILDHLAIYQVENPGQRIGEIVTAPDVLEKNPLIGRPVVNGKTGACHWPAFQRLPRALSLCAGDGYRLCTGNP
jgi:plasmid stabilization system protein ParE